MVQGIAKVDYMDYIMSQMLHNIAAAIIAAIAFLIIPLIL